MVIDVRKKSEYDSQHVEGALNIPNTINQHLAEIPKDKPFILHCQGGYRSNDRRVVAEAAWVGRSGGRGRWLRCHQGDGRAR